MKRERRALNVTPEQTPETEAVSPRLVRLRAKYRPPHQQERSREPGRKHWQEGSGNSKAPRRRQRNGWLADVVE